MTKTCYVVSSSHSVKLVETGQPGKEKLYPNRYIRSPFDKRKKQLTKQRLNLLQLTSSDSAIESDTYMDVACFKYSCKKKNKQTVRYFAI